MSKTRDAATVVSVTIVFQVIHSFSPLASYWLASIAVAWCIGAMWSAGAKDTKKAAEAEAPAAADSE